MDLNGLRNTQTPPSRSPHSFSPASSGPGLVPGPLPPPTTEYGGSEPYHLANTLASPGSRSAPLPPNGMPPTFSYTSNPASASAPPGHRSDHYLSHEAGTSSHGLSPVHPPSSLSAQQKRAYRQRRKDPSCDACRERKVKCDATDTSACSECSSRNVKCQFTKETNRRMSSMKQVQDLERQLLLARKHNNELSHRLQERGSAEWSSSTGGNVSALALPESTVTERRPTQPSLDSFDEVRANIRKFGKGIFKPAPPHRRFGAQPAYPHVGHTIPSKSVADRLIDNYHQSIHEFAPMLHWPTFLQEYEELYRAGTFEPSRQIWVALFYAVLACGTLMEPQTRNSSEESEGSLYAERCIRSMNTWSDELTVDHVRSALLLSIFFMEVNLRSPGWIWLGSAVRIAQDIGLQMDNGPSTPMEAEMRRRVWWSVYYWDRVVSLEIGRPLMIDDDECDVGEPAPVDDEYIRPSGVVPGQVTPSALLVVVPVVRITAQLKKTFKSPTIAKSTLDTCDEHFKSIMATWPDPFPSNSQQALDPRLLTAGCSLNAQRFFLYRHNLSPVCRAHDRADALSRCVFAAKETAHYIERSLHHPSTSPAQGFLSPQHLALWSARLRSTATAFFCNHLWRCELVLCLRGEFGPALSLVHASAAIGDLRRNNVACGRFLAFFLDRLIAKLRIGATQQQLDADEEMLAYVSGDMQGCAEDAWAWVGGDPGADTTNNSPPPVVRIGGPALADKPSLQAEQLSTSTLTEREANEWGGWEAIQRTLTQLGQEQQSAATTPQQQHHQQQQQQHGHSAPAPSRHQSATGPSPYPPPPTASQFAVSHQQQHHHHHQQQQPTPPQPLHSAVQSSRVSLSPNSGNGGNSRISIQDII